MFVIFLNLQAEKVNGEMEAKCEKKIAECKEESQQYLARVQEEHATLVCAESAASLTLNCQTISFNK